MKTIRRILARIKEADEKFSLIDANDKLVIGISGGKDSLAMFYALSLYNLYSKKNFTLYPVLIDMGFKETDYSKIANYIKNIGYHLTILDKKEIYKILSLHKDEKGLLPCSICAKMRKSIIDEYAHSVGAKKVAFAHHLDDALETLLMNMIFGGRIATFSPYMHLDKDDIDFIRPFIFVKEHQIISLVNEEKIPTATNVCPNDKQTMREKMKEYLHQVYIDFPIAKLNFCHMLLDDVHRDLWDNLVKEKVGNEDIYLMPVTTPKQARLEMSILKNKYDSSLMEDINKKHTLIYSQNKPIGVIIFQMQGKNRTIFLLHVKRGYSKIKKAVYTALITNKSN